MLFCGRGLKFGSLLRGEKSLASTLHFTFFRLHTLKDTAKALAVDLLRLNTLSSLFQELGQGDNRKSGQASSGSGREKGEVNAYRLRRPLIFSPASRSPLIPLVAHPLFRSSPLTESPEQANLRGTKTAFVVTTRYPVFCFMGVTHGDVTGQLYLP